MVRNDTPYEFGDVRTDGGLGGDELPSGAETVIVDGRARSFRSYVAGDTD